MSTLAAREQPLLCEFRKMSLMKMDKVKLFTYIEVEIYEQKIYVTHLYLWSLHSQGSTA